MDKNQFKNNMLKAIADAEVHFDPSCSKFMISPIHEENVKYNSADDYLRIWMFNEKNLKDRYFTLNEAIDFLAQPNLKYPLWVTITNKDSQGVCVNFELQISLRFRTTTQLKYIESGHPPFIFKKM